MDSPGRTATVLFVVLFVLGPSAALASGGATVTDVRFTGGIVETEGSATFLGTWQSQRIEADVAGDGPHDVCLVAGSGGERRDLACQQASLGPGNTTVSFEVTSWPANLTGQQTVSVVVRGAGGGDEARADRPVVVLQPTGDYDDDGLGNRRETELGTSVTIADSDDDGLTDGEEVNRYGTDPLVPDTDGDGLGDGVEVDTHGSNPTAVDTDADNLTDRREVTVFRTDPTRPDTDGDGLSDGSEVNQYGTDPLAEDSDGDGLADGREINVHGTDPTLADTDGDGLEDGPEVNRYGTNPTEPDTDGDGLDDGAEVNQYGTNPTKPDTDGDGRSDGREVAAGTDPSEGVWALPVGWRDLGRGLGLAVAVAALGAVAVVAARHRETLAAAVAGLPDRLPDDDVADQPTGENDTERLTSEGRVLRLLNEHNGRLPQSEIVDRTGWSKAKVSRLLSRMEDEGEVRKISVGRGNLIAIPGNEPEHARSPFEDD